MLPNHAYISFTNIKNSPNAIVSIRKETDDDTYECISEFFDDNFKRNGKHSQWLVKADEAHGICTEVDRLIEEMDNEEDESDDELIQEALSRRYKTASEGKVDTRELVEDSEDEHIIGLSRRLRHIYAQLATITKALTDLTSRVEYLEQFSQ